jgi:hypothetical protein
VIEGAGHATHILDMHPRIVDRIADWLATRLNAAAGHDDRNRGAG